MIEQPSVIFGLQEFGLCAFATAIILYFILPKFFKHKTSVINNEV